MRRDWCPFGARPAAGGRASHTMRATQRKGDIATARAVATFTLMGCDVSIPLTESAFYDLIVDDGRRLYRVQCKFVSTPEVDLRRIHSNSTGYVTKLLPDGPTIGCTSCDQTARNSSLRSVMLGDAR
jgi:hypothetical protein